LTARQAALFLTEKGEQMAATPFNSECQRTGLSDRTSPVRFIRGGGKPEARHSPLRATKITDRQSHHSATTFRRKARRFGTWPHACGVDGVLNDIGKAVAVSIEPWTLTNTNASAPGVVCRTIFGGAPVSPDIHVAQHGVYVSRHGRTRPEQTQPDGAIPSKITNLMPSWNQTLSRLSRYGLTIVSWRIPVSFYERIIDEVY